MAWPKGQTKEKTGGRQKGTPNKRTQILQEILEELGVDVPRELVRILHAGEQDEDDFNPDDVLSAKERADILMDLMQYLYPKRKAIEHSGVVAHPLEAYMSMSPEERQTRIAKLQKRIAPPSTGKGKT